MTISPICLDEVYFFSSIPIFILICCAYSRYGKLRFLYHCQVIFLTNLCHAVLSGTKYGLKQTRGKFGLGAKMVRMTLLGF